ncbi:hypothetical protein WMY93_012533 [Mugilogobius chulae]|uniref:Choline transporter-like protein n=1 Tax=Mugilogobius chulae TaxID=88201 RepID=A0AAW0P994_9GOBI
MLDLLRPKREWRPLEDRSCTDLPWFLLFTAFCVGMGGICGFTVATGGAARLLFGYDSFGNTCGERNERLEGVRLSGLDHTDRKFVFFLDPCDIDLVQRRIRSMALCVSLCPNRELKTYEDLRSFAMNNGSELCSYELAAHNYPSLPERFDRCPKLPVPRSKPLPLLRRCSPVQVSCYARLAVAVVTFVGDDSVLHRLIAGVSASRDVIIGLCFLALVLSMLLMLIIRYISTVLVWVLTGLVVLGSLGGTGVLWWLYIDHRLHGNDTVTTVRPRDRSNEGNVGSKDAVTKNQALLVYAGAATVFTLVLMLLMLFMRKRVALTVALFHVAGKVFLCLPLLAALPFITLLFLLLFWSYWVLVLLFLGTSGDPVPDQDSGLVEFRLQGNLQYLPWFHAVGLVWISEFILACQQMTIAGAVVTYYFTRDKARLPATPILSSVLRLVRYHLGTVAKGSFIITLVKAPRLLLMYLHNQLRGKENACARCLLKSCICCLWCLEKCLNYLNQNAYAATAINSTSFCVSARDAFVILVENTLRVATINAVGDFVLFLGADRLMHCLCWVLVLNYQRDLSEWLLPLVFVCLGAFLVSHCFLSVFEIVVDVLFLCFAIDTKYNDGTPGKEFYMDKALMEFVESSRRVERGLSRRRVKGAESEPMVSDVGGVDTVAEGAELQSEEGVGLQSEEWAELEASHVPVLVLALVLDLATSREPALVQAFSEDFLLFLGLYLPTCTLFLLCMPLTAHAHKRTSPAPKANGTSSAHKKPAAA